MSAGAAPADVEEFDYVVVGAGSAGCVVAERLSRDTRQTVLVVEAGGEDNWIWFHIPVGYLFAIGNPRADWMFTTAAEAGLGGRSIAYPRGKVVGGSSAINAMIAMRGQAADYDGWAGMGLPGWSWSEVLPIFRSIEDHFLGDGPLHGAGGMMKVQPPRLRWDILDKVADAATEIGIPRVADFNGGDNFGVGYFHVNQHMGRRWSAARGFLATARRRGNVAVRTGTDAGSLVLEGRMARGVRLRTGTRQWVARARREVILCAGAIGSPILLQRSGIGSGAHLQGLGIEVQHDLPGVGENLQDHLQLRTIFTVEGVETLNTQYHNLLARAQMGLNYLLFRRGPLTMAPSQLGIFARSSPGVDRADLEFHIQPLSLGKFGEPLHTFPAITVSVCNLRPSSRGTVRLASRDPGIPPAIAPHYLTTEADLQIAARSIRLARSLMRQPALEPYRPGEYLPGPQVGDTDEALIEAAGAIGTTIFHPVGTARMGADDDREAVVDARLRVRDIGSLRVADASVMPAITSGNTNTPTMMIGAKAGEMIVTDAR